MQETMVIWPFLKHMSYVPNFMTWMIFGHKIIIINTFGKHGSNSPSFFFCNLKKLNCKLVKNVKYIKTFFNTKKSIFFHFWWTFYTCERCLSYWIRYKKGHFFFFDSIYLSSCNYTVQTRKWASSEPYQYISFYYFWVFLMK